MPVYLIRHTTPDTPKGTCYGITDMEIVEDMFAGELNAIRDKLDGFLPDRIYSSPLKRCVRLSRSLWDQHEIAFDERLKELNFGSWEMRKWDNIPFEEVDHWAQDYVNRSAPQGESYVELYKRVLDIFNEIPRDKNIAIVTHGGVIRAIVSYILGMPLHKSFLLNLPYGAVVRLDDSRFGDYKVKFC